MAMIPRRAWHRVYGDFLMPSRLENYRALLKQALAAGYTICSIERFWSLIQALGVDPARRYLILRNDIDTGPWTAREMWRIELSLGIVASYFFRLSSLDLGIMDQMAASGVEPSYHYEELATVAKRRGLRTRSELESYLPEAQDLFARNVAGLRSRTGQPIRVVAAHGDFVNRKLGLPNTAILADRAFRAQIGIELETYDAAFMDTVSSRHADLTSPPWWTPARPALAIARGEPVVYVLVHPRSWHVERRLNARDDVRRTWEGVRFALPSARRQR